MLITLRRHFPIRVEPMSLATDYIHALRFSALNAFYDPVVRLTTRESKFKSALLAGMVLKSGQRVLDVGCGTGTLACMLSQLESRAEIHGLDGDADMLDRARRKAVGQGRRIQFAHGLAYPMPYPDQYFDAVVSSLFFHHLDSPSKQQVLCEIFRVLKPCGQLHIADWGKAHDSSMRAAFVIVQLLDGFETTRDCLHGAVPEMMRDAQFDEVRVDERIRTALGTIEIVRGTKRPKSRV
jgi:SAM-dependent methyltransferase